MMSISASTARTHLSELLERVALGEEFTITRRGKPVARLSSMRPAQAEQASTAAAQLRNLRQDTTLSGLDWRALRDGRSSL